MLRAAASCSSRALIVRGCSGLVAAAAAAAAVYRAPPACAGRALADAEGPGAAQCGPMVAGRMRGLGLWSPGGEITVQPLKGGGSSESEGVFVIANETGAPAKTVSDQRVVFKRMKPDKLRVERMLAAQRAFEAVGVCPAVVAAGDNWWVEAFAGSVPERVPHRSPEHDRWVDRRAALAARLHRAPPAWFDPIRSKCIAANPVLAALPDDSALWPIAAYHSRALDRFTGDELRRLDAAVPRPLSVAGRRLVSVHADLHRQNLVEETPGGVLVAVDTEFACVSSAVQDLLYHMGPPSSRRAFAAAYLREAAKGVGAADAAGATDEMLLLETDLLAFDILVRATPATAKTSCYPASVKC